jgi:hypothetical protein
MTEEPGDDDRSDQRLRDLVIAIPIGLLWLGIPAVILTILWLGAFVAAEYLTSIDIPAVTVDIVSAAGGPPTISGVPTLLPIVAGLVTWIIWVVRYGRHGGNSETSEEFAERNREDRRFDL